MYNAAGAYFMFEKISSVAFEGSAISHNYYGYFSHVLMYKIEPDSAPGQYMLYLFFFFCLAVYMFNALTYMPCVHFLNVL